MEIPAGYFTYGRPEQHPWDSRWQSRWVDTFWISRYPITASQFQAFIDDGGYENNIWWDRLNLNSRPTHYLAEFNQPARNIDWYSACAFCNWLSNRARQKIRLPTEGEWEKAARGESDSRNYPWGNAYISGYANIDELSGGQGIYDLSTTSTVGIYPQGISPYGVEDMCGNVLEWCIENDHSHSLNFIKEKKYIRRGSSWADSYCNLTIRRPTSTPGSQMGFRVIREG